MNSELIDGGRIENPALRVDMAGDAGQHGVARSQYPVPGRTPEYNRRVAGHEITHVSAMRIQGVAAQP
jgi:hypothetical protein